MKMNRKLPSGRTQGHPFVIPNDWTPEQAATVYNLLDDLLTTVIHHYRHQIDEELFSEGPWKNPRSKNLTKPF